MAGAYELGVDNWMIIAVYVREEFRGKGFAEKLIASIENELKLKKVTKATLMVNKEQKRAVGFYKKLGYQIIGEKVGLILGDGQPHDEYVMEKSLV